MISNGDIAVWISGFSLSQGLAVWRVLGEEHAVNVFVALAVVALFGEPINRDVVEVPHGHYDDAQRRGEGRGAGLAGGASLSTAGLGLTDSPSQMFKVLIQVHELGCRFLEFARCVAPENDMHRDAALLEFFDCGYIV